MPRLPSGIATCQYASSPAKRLSCSGLMRTVERVSISAFVDPDDHEQLVERARLEDRSLSAELRLAIREHLRSGERTVVTAGAAARDGEDT